MLADEMGSLFGLATQWVTWNSQIQRYIHMFQLPCYLKEMHHGLCILTQVQPKLFKFETDDFTITK